MNGFDLSDLNLQGVRLEGADLLGTEMTGAHLRAADLPGANSVGCRLEHAGLQRANLAAAKLCEAFIAGAHPQFINFAGVILESTDFVNARFHNTKNFPPNSVKRYSTRGGFQKKLSVGIFIC
ncbi:MAG: pentapeptide repeat-containing protein [Deltaproteobacteria bacterium]|nr:pentapeptide repeat-containing protein [Deltaproteobacteria bacterium]